MKSKITTIVFDFGDVLIQDKTKELESKYDFDSMPAKDKKRYIAAFHKSEIGLIPTKELLTVMHDTLIKNMSTKQIENYILHSIILPPWKLALQLKKKGYRVYIFSNNQRTWPRKFARILQTDFFQFPYINSATAGLRKPHPNFYKLLLSKYDINPNETIFIDDKSKNLPPAEKLGIRTFHYQQNYRRLVTFLKSQKVLF
jgi:HAD superfamily hydrolase (TIGR01509 family)